MRLLHFEQLNPLKGITYCRVHISRLEDAGKFPRRRQLGHGRVGWLEHEIDDWLSNLPVGKLPLANGVITTLCKSCGKSVSLKRGPGRPYQYCSACRGQQLEVNP
jgi:prophage regulatory protein